MRHNVKITKFRDVVEARTVHCSSSQCLICPKELLSSKVSTYRLHLKLLAQQKKKLSINWKVHEATQSQDCFSLSEVLLIHYSCKATFFASVGEIFLPITWKALHESEEERMFIRRRLGIKGDNDLAEDIICTGCQLCGAPLNSGLRFSSKQDKIPLSCPKSYNHLHRVSLIYRPFMLYVWDDSKYIPLLVTNQAAELLFGSIRAEAVYSCYTKQKHDKSCYRSIVNNENQPYARVISLPNAVNGGIGNHDPMGQDKRLGQTGKNQYYVPNLYLIWLILLRLLLRQGKNSPLKFKVSVDATRDWDGGKYELLSINAML
ncbi:hypothetical protein RJ639_024256 [Escallonia herrerae]|uniref:Uncharacterized protein n=1 Tax=Escallonia herrerae TaxID=1293975 RepID=A0AA89AEF6_9ASTE|nr:hypothetical protein RJ639_024256 [Escallonia herrerae]